MIPINVSNIILCIADCDVEVAEDEIESPDMREYIKKITPGHVLAFATGANQAPACGFGRPPRINFVHDTTKTVPSANTCSNELFLFVNKKTTSDLFQGYMVVALMNGAIFSTL